MTVTETTAKDRGVAPEPSGRIVVGVDGSNGSIEALDWAIGQAGLTGSTLEIVIAWDWPGNYGWNLPLSGGYDPEAEARKLVDSLALETRKSHPTMNIRVRSEHGYPGPALVAASEGADLLVVGCRGHGEFVGMLVGSVSEYCATKAHCPVVVYRGVHGQT